MAICAGWYDGNGRFGRYERGRYDDDDDGDGGAGAIGWHVRA